MWRMLCVVAAYYVASPEHGITSHPNNRSARLRRPRAVPGGQLGDRSQDETTKRYTACPHTMHITVKMLVYRVNLELGGVKANHFD